MYIQKEALAEGWNDYLCEQEGKGADIGMDVALLILEPEQEFELCEPEKEAALLLFEGAAEWSVEQAGRCVSRTNPFRGEASCLHVCAGTPVRVRAGTHCEIYVQMVRNSRAFAPVFYMPEDIQTQRAGLMELQGTMRRNIKTVFDYENAPYSNMVLGEVLNFPGKWSSYPPHHHPQPEVYFYRYDKPQGFGVGFANGNVYRTGHNGLLVIEHDCHSQAAAPGYGLCYVWGIRHLDGNPWKKTRIDDPAHTWMMQSDAAFLEE